MRGLYVFLTVEEVSQPRSGTVHVIRDSWWATTPDGKVAMYVLRPGGDEHPQANTNRSITERFRARGPEDPLTGEPVFIPLAFYNHRCEG